MNKLELPIKFKSPWWLIVAVVWFCIGTFNVVFAILAPVYIILSEPRLNKKWWYWRQQRKLWKESMKKKRRVLYPKHRYFNELGMYDSERQVKDALEAEAKIDVVLSGDPKRAKLCKRIADFYRGKSLVKNVFLMFERNPAVAFNKGCRLAKSPVVFCVAGDVTVYKYLGEISRFLKPNTVLYIQAEKDQKIKRDKYSFTSGAFMVHRLDLLDNPIPESPDFAEEILYPRTAKLRFEPFYTDAYIHHHKHTFREMYVKNRERTQLRAELKGRGLLGRVCVVFDLFDAAKAVLQERT